MTQLPEHAARRALIDELHARPFTPLEAPARIVHLAFINDEDAPASAEEKTAHLAELLDHLGGGAPHGPIGNHHVAWLGGLLVKWERHTEFVSVTITELSPPEQRPLFQPALLERLPEGWLARAPGRVITATAMEVMLSPSREASAETLDTVLGAHFNRDSWAVAFVASGLALATSDFRRDPDGFVRMALLIEPTLGPRRVGRVCQRLLELETYRGLAMLALPMARGVGGRLSELDADLERLVREGSERASLSEPAPGGARASAAADRKMLEELTRIAAELETLAASTAFRFGAARAYSAIVSERIEVLREDRARDRQLFREFMVRRFTPAMRTVTSTADRLSALSARAERAANLLRTRVDVSLEAQNQALLESMNRRAKLQLRLQQTVEGLSVVAISYYAVSLAGYVLEPIGKSIDVSSVLLKGLVTFPIIGIVWMFVRRLRKRAEQSGQSDDDV